jgi:hypothetical protein
VKAAAAQHVMPTVDPSMVLIFSSNRTLKKQWRGAARTHDLTVNLEKLNVYFC